MHAPGLWFDDLDRRGLLPPERDALAADAEVDVVIVGAGLTGLWTAHSILVSDPSTRVLVVEAESVGFGASGRNGGWCSALFPTSATALEQRYGFDRAVAMRRAMVDTVDEVGRSVADEGIDCGFQKGGTYSFVRDRAQLTAAREELSEAHRFGVDAVELIGTDRLRERMPGVDAVAAVHATDCARVQPAALVTGLAAAVEQRGGRIVERTRAVSWQPGRLRVSVSGRSSADASVAEFEVRADAIVIATEAYGAQLPQIGRRVLPLYSLMIATAPLPASVWDEIGIVHGTTFTDYRHLLVYGQRTADDRFAFGGRGARYHAGSTIDPAYDTDERVARHLAAALADLVPATRGVEITHHWGGPLGVPRDWHASVGFDRSTGIGWAGGYVGDGVATTNLAGRTLADLIAGRSTELTGLPWVDHVSPHWEPEPLRFAGANLGLVGMTVADWEEKVTGRPSRAARLMAPLTGH